MKIGDCKQGDRVWFNSTLEHEPVEIEVLDDATNTSCSIPRKRIKVLNSSRLEFLEDLFYGVDCYKTKEEALIVKSSRLNGSFPSQDFYDINMMYLFTQKQKEFDYMDKFIKHLVFNGTIGEHDYENFKKDLYKGSLFSTKCLIEELKEYGNRK